MGYDDLTADPGGELRRIYSELGISGFEALEKSLAPELDSLKRYKRNQFVEDEHWARRVSEQLHEAFEHFGYQSPM